MHTRSRRSVGWVFVGVVLSLGGPSSGQMRPSIPEPACTRVDLVATVGLPGRPRSVGLRIENHDPGDFPALLRPEIGVEREVGGRWEPVRVAGFLMRAQCTTEPRTCVTIAPRSAVTVVPWTGMQGDGQCVCTRCAPAPAGRYRFTVTTCQQCQSPVTAESAPFTLPP